MTPPRSIAAAVRRLFSAAAAAGWLAVGAQTAEAEPVPLNITAYGSEAGLPSNSAHVVLPSSQGYLWIGTDAGLVRFDGLHFTTFRTAGTPGLAGNLITALHEDAAGTLWIGTGEGLSSHRAGRFVRHPEIKAPVTDFSADAYGSLWISTYGAGLWELKDGELRPNPNGWLNPTLRASVRLHHDAAGRLWVGLAGSGLAYIEDGELKVHPAMGLDCPEVGAFAEDAGGTLWVGTVRGVHRIADDRAEPVNLENRDGRPERINALLADSDGRMWLAGDALYRADPAARGEPARLVVSRLGPCASVIRDREGNLWVGTLDRGLVRLQPGAFEIVADASAEPRAVAVDPAGTVWVGGREGGLLRIVPGRPAEPIDLGGGDDGEVRSLGATRAGEIWIGTGGALARWRDGAVARFPELRDVRRIHEDPDGRVWFAPEAGGVHVREGEAFVPLAGRVGRAGSTAACFGDGPDGSVFVALKSREGLFRIRGGEVTRPAAPEGVPGEVLAIHTDAQGGTWFGTRQHGLVLLREGRWFNPGALGEVFKESIPAIGEDAQGRLWIATPRGLFWADRQEVLAIALGQQPVQANTFRLVRPGDGVPNGAVAPDRGSILQRDAAGALWFATRSGIVRVRPEHLRKNAIPPAVAIERIVADEAELLQDGPLVVPAGTRSLAIAYAGIGFIRPEGLAFRYRLAGYDAGWTGAGPRRTAYYTNLRPGRYAFEVEAANEDGVWSAMPARLEFSWQPRFWQTWWFYALVLAALGVAVGAAHWLRVLNLRRAKARLERRVHKRTEELLRAKEAAENAARIKANFLSNVSHEIRTPLNGIVGMTSLLIDTELTSEQRELADTVRRSGDTLLAIVNDILDVAKLETEKPELERVAFEPRALAEEVVELQAEAARAKDLDLVLVCADEVPPEVLGDPGRIQQVLAKLVDNAIKFTPRGDVAVKIGFQAATDAGDPFLRFEVRDTGIGLTEEDKRRLFQSFSQVDGSLSRRFGGTGLGLAICKHLVEAMGGRIGVESLPDRGSVFWFSIRLDREASVPPRPAPLPAFQGRTVLVALANPTEREMLAHTLRRWGARTAQAVDGPATLAAVQATDASGSPPPALVIDAHLPPNGGFEVAATIRHLPAWRSAAIVVLSKDPDAGRRKPADDPGMPVLQKPFRIAALQRALEKAWTSPAAAPAQPSREAAPEPGHKAAPAAPPAGPAPSARILIAEDNIVNQKLTKRHVTKLGFAAEVVGDGREAVEAVLSRHYDLVLMDCQMPHMSGFEAAAEIRSREPGGRHVPIVAVTANAIDLDRERFLQAGMCDVLGKPLRLQELQAVLEKWLKPGQPVALEQAPPRA